MLALAPDQRRRRAGGRGGRLGGRRPAQLLGQLPPAQAAGRGPAVRVEQMARAARCRRPGGARGGRTSRPHRRRRCARRRATRAARGAPAPAPRPPRRTRPHGIATTTSGRAARSSSQVAVRESRPGSPATLRPPASSIISGTQWPPTYGGSSHSSATTRGRGAPATASRTRSSRACKLGCAAPRRGPARRWPRASRTRSSSTSPRVPGSSEITSGRDSSRSATARTSS